MDDSSRFTWYFHINGQVQGIGFRPYVYRIATRLELKGCVSNEVDGVHILFNSTQNQADNFVLEILKTVPSLSRITSSRLRKTDFITFDSFEIIQTESTSQSQIAITPDFALCEDCRLDRSNCRAF